MKTTFSIVLLLLLNINVFCQEQNTEKKKFQLSGLNGQSAFFNDGNVGSLENFRKLAPNSTFLQSDFEDFIDPASYISASRSALSIALEFNKLNADGKTYNPNITWRIGVSYYSLNPLRFNIRKDKSTTFDTLKSQHTGKEYYLDSTKTVHYAMTYYSEQIRLDASVVFRTNTESRLSLFAGAGVTAGAAYQSRTAISKTKTTTISFTDPAFFQINRDVMMLSKISSSEDELFRSKSNFGASLYVPLGVDFRLANKHEFWDKLHIFYEARPSFGMVSIPEVEHFFYAHIQHGVGVRISW